MESSVDRVMNWTAGVGSRPNCWAKRLVVPGHRGGGEKHQRAVQARRKPQRQQRQQRQNRDEDELQKAGQIQPRLPEGGRPGRHRPAVRR